VGERISLLVVGDGKVVADVLEPLLAQAPELNVAATARTVGEAIEAAKGTEPEVVLMNLPLPDTSEADATRRIRAELPEVAVLFLGADVSDEAMVHAVNAGACGYVSTASTPEELSRAIRRADVGEFLLPPATMSRMLASQRQARRGAAREGESEQLTDREHEVLRLVASGLHNSDVAAQLDVGYGTVRGLVRGILEKLGARSRLQAVALARESRLIDS
jgi:DNA-binding NarL/FixJ family response regulator